MFFGDRFYIGRKGETGEGGWGHHQAKKSVAVSGLYCRMALVGPRWPLSLPLCINRLTKTVLSPPISGSEAFPSLDEWSLAKNRDYCKLINGWVWVESQSCSGCCKGTCVKLRGDMVSLIHH